MAIEVRHSPSARSGLYAGYESALQTWREGERRRALQEQMQRDQMAQAAEQAQMQRDLQERMQVRGIDDVQKRQLIDWQGRSYLQDDQQDFSGTQSYYDRNQAVGLEGMRQGFYAGQNQADRDVRTYLQDDQQAFVGAQSAAAAQGAIANREDTQQFALDQIVFSGDEATRQQVEQLQRQEMALRKGLEDGTYTKEEFETGMRSLTAKRAGIDMSPHREPPRAQDMVDYIELPTEDGKMVKIAVWKDPENPGQFKEIRGLPDVTKGQLTPKDQQEFDIKKGEQTLKLHAELYAAWLKAPMGGSAADGKAAIPAPTIEDAREMVEKMYGGAPPLPPDAAPEAPPAPTPEQAQATQAQYGQILKGMPQPAQDAFAMVPPSAQKMVAERFLPGTSLQPMMSDFLMLDDGAKEAVMSSTLDAYMAILAARTPHEQQAAMAEYAKLMRRAMSEAVAQTEAVSTAAVPAAALNPFGSFA